MAWIQFIFDSTPDAAERLSDALSECGAAAVTFQDNADQPIYEPEIGTTPLWAATNVVALFDAEQDIDTVINALSHKLRPQAVPNYRIEAVEDKDWVREWMDSFQPICFGERLWICPSWLSPVEPDAVNIMLDPGLAFGTGTHPTTALCLNWLDQADVKDKYVIDYGCGSGILAIAAALLGAKKVIGVDTDPQALEATQANAARNGVHIETYFPDQCPNEPADLIISQYFGRTVTVTFGTFSPFNQAWRAHCAIRYFRCASRRSQPKLSALVRYAASGFKRRMDSYCWSTP